jgi:DNA-directed RNA polymerase specialized sigma24 family protein
MSSPAEIDERLATEEVSPLSPEERDIADKCLAALTPEERAIVTEMDLFTLVRGYQTYTPRLEESITALKVGV